ncbi:MAG: cohesin domain-containing protein [Patescibacteria group bacterium]
MSKRTFSLIFTLFTVGFVLVMISLYNPSSYDKVKSPVSPTPTPTPEPLAQTELRFGVLESFPPVSSPNGEKITYSIPITISTNKNKITAVQLEMSYDPKVLTIISLSPGTFFPKPVTLLEKEDEDNGRISYAIGIAPNTPGIEGEGVVATLTFQTKSQFLKTTQISFLPKTLVTAEGSNQSVLKEAFSSQIVVGENIDN